MSKEDIKIIITLVRKIKSLATEFESTLKEDHKTLDLYTSSILSKFMVSNKNTDYVPLEPIEGEVRNCYKHRKDYTNKLHENNAQQQTYILELENLLENLQTKEK